jgi:hypothetical protein
MLTSTAIGRAGEYLAASAIELLGWGVSVANLQHIDFLAVNEDRVLKIQVKATMRRNADGRYHFTLSACKRHMIKPQNVDIVALVMLDTKRVYFMSATGLGQTFAVNNTILAMENMEQESWDAALKQCGDAKRG